MTDQAGSGGASRERSLGLADLTGSKSGAGRAKSLGMAFLLLFHLRERGCCMKLTNSGGAAASLAASGDAAARLEMNLFLLLLRQEVVCELEVSLLEEGRVCSI